MLQTTTTVLHQYQHNKVIKSYQYRYRFFWNHTDYCILRDSNKLYFRLFEWTPMSQSYQIYMLFHKCIEIKEENILYHIIKLSFPFVCLTASFQENPTHKLVRNFKIFTECLISTLSYTQVKSVLLTSLHIWANQLQIEKRNLKQDLGHHFWNYINTHSNTFKDKQSVCASKKKKQCQATVHTKKSWFTFPLISDIHKTSERNTKSRHSVKYLLSNE